MPLLNSKFLFLVVSETMWWNNRISVQILYIFARKFTVSFKRYAAIGTNCSVSISYHFYLLGDDNLSAGPEFLAKSEGKIYYQHAPCIDRKLFFVLLICCAALFTVFILHWLTSLNPFIIFNVLSWIDTLSSSSINWLHPSDFIVTKTTKTKQQKSAALLS